MLCNLAIDINANTVLVFSWEARNGEVTSGYFYTLLVERMAPYPPVTLSDGLYTSEAQVSRAALAAITDGRLFKITAFDEKYPSLVSVLELSYGSLFQRAWDAILQDTDVPSGVVYSEINENRAEISE